MPTSITTETNGSCDHDVIPKANPKHVSINDVIAIKNQDCKFSIGFFLMVTI